MLIQEVKSITSTRNEICMTDESCTPQNLIPFPGANQETLNFKLPDITFRQILTHFFGKTGKVTRQYEL